MYEDDYSESEFEGTYVHDVEGWKGGATTSTMSSMANQKLTGTSIR